MEYKLKNQENAPERQVPTSISDMSEKLTEYFTHRQRRRKYTQKFGKTEKKKIRIYSYYYLEGLYTVNAQDIYWSCRVFACRCVFEVVNRRVFDECCIIFRDYVSYVIC